VGIPMAQTFSSVPGSASYSVFPCDGYTFRDLTLFLFLSLTGCCLLLLHAIAWGSLLHLPGILDCVCDALGLVWLPRWRRISFLEVPLGLIRTLQVRPSSSSSSSSSFEFA